MLLADWNVGRITRTFPIEKLTMRTFFFCEINMNKYRVRIMVYRFLMYESCFFYLYGNVIHLNLNCQSVGIFKRNRREIS